MKHSLSRARRSPSLVGFAILATLGAVVGCGEESGADEPTTSAAGNTQSAGGASTGQSAGGSATGGGRAGEVGGSGVGGVGGAGLGGATVGIGGNTSGSGGAPLGLGGASTTLGEGGSVSSGGTGAGGGSAAGGATGAVGGAGAGGATMAGGATAAGGSEQGGSGTGGGELGGGDTGGTSTAGSGSGGDGVGGVGIGGGTTAPSTFSCNGWAGILTDDESEAILLDFNEASRQEAEVNEPGWNPWPTADVNSESKTVDGVTFTVRMAGSGGSSLTTDWAKVLVQTPHYARLVGDGLTVADGNSGGAIELEISGLSAGEHSLLAYHNGVNGYQMAELNVDVNGSRQVTNLVPTNRALSMDASASSYVTFTVDEGGSATIVYSPNPSTSSSYKNVIINAIALDRPDPARQASNESPANRDYHADADSGSITLSWTAADGAVAHDVYFGTDGTAVDAATKDSPEFKGTQSGTSYEVSEVSNLQFYFWRVDETDGSGVTTKGSLWRFSPRQLAFPDAEGYGRFARGGRCGKVVHVTNLNDSGAGSLREAVENDIGPRTIVFDVSGIIRLNSRLVINQPYVTVAGQTAPGKGITVRAAPFGLSGTTDIVMRYMRVRLGGGTTYDGMGMTGGDHSIYDHNSISWTIDEAFSSRGAKNITLQHTLISECLNVAGHQNYPAGTAHGYAASISGDVGSFHHNLLAHCEGRNWSLAGGLDGDGYYAGRLDIFNNVVYNWDGRTTDGGAHEVNFVNNYYKAGAATSRFTVLNPTYDGFPGTQQYYMAGNLLPGHCDLDDQMGCTAPGGTPPYDLWVDQPFFPSHAQIDSAEEAYKKVLSDVGCQVPELDDHDVRVVVETLAGNYHYSGSASGLPGLPDNEADVGGYEDYPELTRAADFDSDGDGLPNWYESLIATSTTSASGDFSDSNADPNGDGYTNLEEYLHFMATPRLELSSGSSSTFELEELFRGFTSSPSYAAESSGCVEASVSGSTLTVTATSGCGIVYLPVTVTDSQGSSLVREVGVLANRS